MRLVLFYHSLVSDWNHGNAHFLRGVVAELLLRGHDVRVYEPRDGWSLKNLREEHGEAPLGQFRAAYPGLAGTFYDLSTLDLDEVLDGADGVIVHEWSEHELVRRVGEHRARRGPGRGGYKLLFHDTHHRAVSDPNAIRAFDLDGYDGVLAFGETLAAVYRRWGWNDRAFVWHEAADTRLFRPIAGRPREGDLVWVGNWGDEERTAELHEFLLGPVKSLGLKARIHGVRYPQHALDALKDAGISYGRWLPNFLAPETFARFGVTVHVPRRPYVQALPGIPTIRVFEALACGIPLVCSPWPDAEGLFTPGADYLVARDGAEMRRHLRLLLNEPEAARALAAQGHRTILSRHTCAHRVDELLDVFAELEAEGRGAATSAAKVPAPATPRRRRALVASANGKGSN